MAGAWRGRRIAVPGGNVRPTADRVREAWMSIVNPALDGARVTAGDVRVTAVRDGLCRRAAREALDGG